MTKSGLKIIFIGTPDFSVASLEAIIEAGFNVVAVITSPDRPAGRGLKLQESAVKVAAVKHGIPVLQPTNLKNEFFLDELRAYKADIQVVIAFRMLPEVVWNMPRLGTFNLHASLLPDYRGAAPINRAIMNGETETGVTTFFLKHEIDTGDIIFREKVAIAENETAGELHDKLMTTGAQLVVKTLMAVDSGTYSETPQEMKSDLKTAPKIFKDDCRIDWTKPVTNIHNHIRGLSPYPAAWTMLGNLNLKIYRSGKSEEKHNLAPGTVVTDNKTFFKVACENGFIVIEELQLEGKKKMGVADFLRGFNLQDVQTLN